MARKSSLAEELIGLLMGRPEVRKVERHRSPCGRCKRRVKIVRNGSLSLGVTEPDHPRYDVHIDTSDMPATATFVQNYLLREGIEVVNK